MKIVAPKVGGVKLDDGTKLPAHLQLAGEPSILFDCVAIIASEAGVKDLLGEATATGWVHDVFTHLKVIAATSDVQQLFDQAGVKAGKSVVGLVDAKSPMSFLSIAAEGRIWDREPAVRTVF